MSTAGDTELIHVRVSYGGSGVWPVCFLVDQPTKEAVERAASSEHPDRALRELDALPTWEDDDSTEKSIVEDGTLLWVFREGTDSSSREAPDPRQTPFFAACSGTAY